MRRSRIARRMIGARADVGKQALSECKGQWCWIVGMALLGYIGCRDCVLGVCEGWNVDTDGSGSCKKARCGEQCIENVFTCLFVERIEEEKEFLE